MNTPVNVSIREINYIETNKDSRTLIEDTIEEDLLPKVTWPVYVPDSRYPSPA
jgi:hypothetical protein